MIKLLLTLFKFAKFGPLLKSAGFMVVSIGVYALAFGWAFAAGFVVLVYLHELGHYVAARRHGMQPGLPAMIPFIGAWTALRGTPLSAAQEASIAFAGPFAGTMAACVVLAIALHEHSALWMALAYSGFFLNLFNLVPIVPFDGGHIIAVLSPKAWFVGLPILVGLLIWSQNPLLLVILLLLAPTIWASLRAAWHGEVPAENPRFYDVPLEARVRYASYYILLLAFLCYMSYETHAQVEALRAA